MVPVYAIALFVGFLLLLVWIVGVGIGTWVEGWEFADPERRFGFVGRSIVAGLVGFGMAGMSASFGGWPPVLAVVGAIGGAAAMVAVARVFGPDAA
jgi:hypothetical protein